MKWYFIRHAETHANVGRLYNPTNDELTPTGAAEAERAAPHIQQLHVDQAFCSALKRARETAALLGVRPVFREELTDRNFGEFTGKPFGSLPDYCKKHGFDIERYAPQGGESVDAWRTRGLEFLYNLEPGDYLFITHAGVIENVVSAFAGKTVYPVENLSLWVFEDGRLVKEGWKPWEKDK